MWQLRLNETATLSVVAVTYGKLLTLNELRTGLQHKEVGGELLLLVLAIFLTELVIHTHRDSVLGAVNLLGNEVKVNGGGGTEVNLSNESFFHILVVF